MSNTLSTDSNASAAPTGHAPPRVRPVPGDLDVALAITAVLALIYLLTFSGQYRSIDEFAMYARTESLALGHGMATPQLTFASLHHPVGPLEPGQSLLAAPLYWLGKAMPGASTIAAVTLFNVLVTALTGGLLYLLVRQLGYTPVVGALTALAWGVGTTAWPYARSFFREPLLGLLWTLAALLCIRWQHTAQRRYAVACMVAVCAGLAVKIAALSALPVFVLALLWDPARQRLRLSRRSAGLLALAAAGGLAVALVAWPLRYETPLPIAAYTWAYPWGNALQVAYGLLLSPVKGIVLFSPILIATLPGWRPLIRQRGTAALMAVGLTATLLYVYGNAPQWHGGSVVWGPRFMVPLLPVLMLPFAAALADRRPWVYAWAMLWSAVGLVVQGAAGTASWSDAVWQMVPAYVGDTLVGLDGIPWWSWRLLPRAPAWVQITGWAPRQLDMLWLRTLTDGTLAIDRLLGTALALLLLFAGAGLVALLLPGPLSAAWRRRIALVSVSLALMGSLTALARSERDANDFYGLTRAEAASLAQTVSSREGAKVTVVYVSNDFFTYPWLGLLKGNTRSLWYSPHDAEGLARVVEQAAGSDTLWLVIDRVHMPADAQPDLARHLLAQQAYEVDGTWVGGYELLSYVPPRAIQPVEMAATWANGLRLEGLALNSTQLAPGDTLLLSLNLAADAPITEDLSLFVHLTPATGPILSGRDGPPGCGAAPTSQWLPGTRLAEKRTVRVPRDAQAGAYTLTAGWLDSRGVPVALTGPGGASIGLEALLGTIEILPAP